MWTASVLSPARAGNPPHACTCNELSNECQDVGPRIWLLAHAVAVHSPAALASSQILDPDTLHPRIWPPTSHQLHLKQS